MCCEKAKIKQLICNFKLHNSTVVVLSSLAYYYDDTTYTSGTLPVAILVRLMNIKEIHLPKPNR